MTIEMSELPETATAELGERFDIPEVTAKKGGKEIAVAVSVKDSKGEEVELQGRGTRFSATDMNGYVVTFSAGEGEEKIVKTLNVQVSDTKGPEISLPASANNMTVKKGATVSVPAATWTDKSEEVTDGGYKVMVRRRRSFRHERRRRGCRYFLGGRIRRIYRHLRGNG